MTEERCLLLPSLRANFADSSAKETVFQKPQCLSMKLQLLQQATGFETDRGKLKEQRISQTASIQDCIWSTVQQTEAENCWISQLGIVITTYIWAEGAICQ